MKYRFELIIDASDELDGYEAEELCGRIKSALQSYNSEEGLLPSRYSDGLHVKYIHLPTFLGRAS